MEQQPQYQIVPFETVMSMGEVFAKSGYFTDAKEQAQAVVKMLAGQEMGVGPFASMSGIHIIKGKPEVGAHLLAAVLRRSGKYTYEIEQPIKPDRVTLEFFERNEDRREPIWKSLGKSTFTAEDARKAGTGNMQKFPRNMLFARALSNGVKWYCPDVSLSPLYSRGEIDQDANAEYTDDEVVDSTATEIPQQEPQPRQEPEETTTETTNGNGRPYGPDELRAKLQAFATMYAVEKDGDAAAELQHGNKIAACMDKLAGDTGRRRTFTKDIFGWESVKDMKLAQFHALNKWMGLPVSGAFDLDGVNTDTCKDEANRLVNAIVTKDAVGELPGMDD